MERAQVGGLSRRRLLRAGLALAAAPLARAARDPRFAELEVYEGYRSHWSRLS